MQHDREVDAVDLALPASDPEMAPVAPTPFMMRWSQHNRIDSWANEAYFVSVNDELLFLRETMKIKRERVYAAATAAARRVYTAAKAAAQQVYAAAIAEPQQVYTAAIAEPQQVYAAAIAEPQQEYLAARAEMQRVYDEAVAKARQEYEKE